MPEREAFDAIRLIAVLSLSGLSFALVFEIGMLYWLNQPVPCDISALMGALIGYLAGTLKEPSRRIRRTDIRRDN